MGRVPLIAMGVSNSRTWRLALTSLAVLATALFGGAVYQNVSLARERNTSPMPGKRVDVGGFRMHLYCTGHGTPTVILDSGLGDSYIEWQTVQPKIAEVVQVCSYDRAGMGYSDPSPHRRTSHMFAEELHALLHSARLPPPYVLVGHSMAGFNIRIYAALYPADVAGMVLVDASHPEQLRRFPPALHAMSLGWIRQGELLEYLEPTGIARFFGYCGDNIALRAAECTFNSFRESASERRSFRESAAQTAVMGGNLGNLPLVVLSHDTDKADPELPADVDKATNTAFNKMQEELRGLSTQGIRVIAKGSGHYIQLDRPDLVIGAVHKIVDQVRGSGSASR